MQDDGDDDDGPRSDPGAQQHGARPIPDLNEMAAAIGRAYRGDLFKHSASQIPQLLQLAVIQGFLSWEDVPDTQGMYELMFRGHRPPIVNIVPITVLKKEIDKKRCRLFSNADLLREIWTRHAAVICKRWGKKSITQRHQILRQAWGRDINLTHRPDMEVFCETYNSCDWIDKSAKRTAMLWPHINLEDLQKPRNLPLLLQSRALHFPGEFTRSDRDLILCDLRKTIVLQELESSGYIMTMPFSEDRERFGTMFHPRELPKGKTVVLRSDTRAPSYLGYLLLEIQERTWAFLVACAKLIMHDVAADGILNPCPDAGASSLATYALGDSWSEIAAEAPYRVTASISFAKVENIIAAIRDAAVDHFWAMREDPDYFVDSVLAFHPATTGIARKEPDVGWRITNLSMGTWNAFVKQYIWSYLLKLLVNWRQMQGDEAVITQVFSEEGARALAYLNYVLQHQLEHQIAELWETCYNGTSYCLGSIRPPLDPDIPRRLYDRDGALKGSDLRIMQLLNFIFDDQTSPNGQCSHYARLTMVIEEAYRLFEAQANNSKFLSHCNAGIFAELANLATCVREVEVFYKSICPLSDLTLPSGEQERKILADFGNPAINARDEWTGLLSRAVRTRKYGKDENWFARPAIKQRTRENVGLARQSEQRLDSLWADFDQILRKHGIAPFAHDARLPETVQRTAPWSDSEASKLAPRAHPSLVQDLAIAQDLKAWYRDLQVNTERSLTSAQASAPVKIKLKTRGLGIEDCSPEDQTSSTSTESLTPPFTLDVNARALKTFTSVFFAPSPGAIPGEISWKDFVNAMVCAGFRAEKMYGSAWKFDPLKIAGERSRSSIIFHEPHPSDKIPYRTARRHGRRLTRTFGWTGETFVLAEKITSNAEKFSKGAAVGSKSDR